MFTNTEPLGDQAAGPAQYRTPGRYERATNDLHQVALNVGFDVSYCKDLHRLV